MNQPKMFRQGDVLLVEESGFESQLDPHSEGQVILAKGERTGHSHVLVSAGLETDWIEDPNHVRLVTAGVLSHEEHAPISIPPGTYGVRRQQQMGWEEDQENVAD